MGARPTVGQNRRTMTAAPARTPAASKIKGINYRVANFRSYHPIEWTATDAYGPLEGFVLLRE